MKKNPIEKKVNAGSLKYLKSSIGPGLRGGSRLLSIKLHKRRIGRLMNATILEDHAKPREGLSMI
jgi:hypothetical protein